MLLSLPLSSAAGNSGEDRLPDTESTPFSSASATSPSVDGELWELSFSLDQGYVDNNTGVEVMSQICTNDGICDPPAPQTLENNGGIYSTSLTPPEDHTYVNFRITLIDEKAMRSTFLLHLGTLHGLLAIMTMASGAGLTLVKMVVKRTALVSD